MLFQNLRWLLKQTNDCRCLYRERERELSSAYNSINRRILVLQRLSGIIRVCKFTNVEVFRRYFLTSKQITNQFSAVTYQETIFGSIEKEKIDRNS